MDKETLRKKWVTIEHDLRYMDSDVEQGDAIFVDKLKNCIIALMGFKLFGDDNDIFYDNMKTSLESAIKILKQKYPIKARMFDDIHNFVKENL